MINDDRRWTRGEVCQDRLMSVPLMRLKGRRMQCSGRAGRSGLVEVGVGVHRLRGQLTGRLDRQQGTYTHTQR